MRLKLDLSASDVRKRLLRSLLQDGIMGHGWVVAYDTVTSVEIEFDEPIRGVETTERSETIDPLATEA